MNNYSALEIADYFIELSNFTISPMKLQKLLYYAQGWHLSEHDKPLINETIEVWRYGPVISSIYYMYKQYGNNNITEVFMDALEGFSPRIEDDIETKKFLNIIYNHYNQYSAIKLSNMTHLSGTPWKQICEKFEGIEFVPLGTDIPEDVLKDYFKKLGGDD